MSKLRTKEYLVTFGKSKIISYWRLSKKVQKGFILTLKYVMMKISSLK